MANEERRDLESKSVQQNEPTPTKPSLEVGKEPSGGGPSESERGRMTLEEILHLGTGWFFLFKSPSHNPIWSFYWPSLGDQVERIERLFVDMLRRRHPDVEIRKADITVPTRVETVGQDRRWSEKNTRRVNALWIGRPSAHQDNLYFVKAVFFHPFGEGINVERYDLVPLEKRFRNYASLLSGILVLGLGILSVLVSLWLSTDIGSIGLAVCLGM